MSYDLYPINKKIKEMSIGAFMWPIMLQETGAGYVVGYGSGRSPASYVFSPDKKGASPVSNDGYKISALEAKMMATVIRGYLSVQRFVNKEWDEMEEYRRKDLQETLSCGKYLYRQYFHEDRLKQFERFAEFAEQSKGFKIH